MGKKSGKPAYPTQPTCSYPVQPQQAPMMGAPPPAYGAAPPPYTPAGAYGQPYPQPYPQPMYTAPPAYAFAANPVGLALGAEMMQQNYVQPAPVPQPNFAFPGQGPVVVRDAFDAGARFDGASQPNIPPPPPGCYPNAAQMASASGRSVVLHQQKTDFLTGGSGGGYALI